jgi:hypothetical protein
MQALGVRSLEGLNLRESLEVLRRQAVRGNDSPSQVTSASPAPRPATPAAPAPQSQAAAARPATAAPTSRIAPAPPRYFDEEDDEEEFTYTIDEEELEAAVAGDGAYGLNDGMPAPIGRAGEDYDELDDLDLDDVPDFGPSAAAPSAPPSRRATGHPAAPTSAPTPAVPPAQVEAAAPASLAAGLIARLRATQPGGGLSSQQRKAYQNIVVAELGETRAAGLIKGVWGLTPDRLGTEQVDELLSWGKRDTFADEATQVLAELRAERQRANGAAATPPAAGPAPRAATRTRSSAPRPPEDGGGF